MIDIHSHVIPFVDDGSRSLESSLDILRTAEKCGVTDIICTPHYRRGMFETPKDKIIENYNILKAANDTGVDLHLGQEIAYNTHIFDMLSKGEILTYCGSDYILLEFSYTKYVDVSGVVFESKLRGYKPVIAHIERYEYLTLEDVEELSYSGALIQVNASSLLFGSRYRGIANKYLKKNFVDFIANDMHVGRKYVMDKAYTVVKRKYGEKTAKELFEENAKILLNNDK